MRELNYLGHMVNSGGIATVPDKVKSIREFPTPTSIQTLRIFLGLASRYRRFIEKFATVMTNLRHLLKKDTKWSWGLKQDEAFLELKRRLFFAPVLACPDFSVEFILQVNASNYGLGAALTQSQNGSEVVIACYTTLSGTTRPMNRNF